MLVNQTYTNIADIFKIPEIAEGLESTYKRKKEDYSNSVGGGLYAQTTFGQVTGFGAGSKDDTKFTGCIGIDDPHKAQDTLIKIASANKAIKGAVLNRKNNHRVPIILIMQRVSKYDLTGFLMEHFKEWFESGKAKLIKSILLKLLHLKKRMTQITIGLNLCKTRKVLRVNTSKINILKVCKIFSLLKPK
jgi:hypothetical protein